MDIGRASKTRKEELAARFVKEKWEEGVRLDMKLVDDDIRRHQKRKETSAHVTLPVKKTRCSLVPGIPPKDRKSDLATQPEGKVPITVANRLRKRKERERQATKRPGYRGFPWNDATRATRDKKSFKRRTDGGANAIPCSVCKEANTRNCHCGATLAEDARVEDLDEFRRFVRSPTTPVWGLADPEDQARFKTVINGVLVGATPRDVIRVVAVAAFSGRPEVIADLADYWIGADEPLVSKLEEYVVTQKHKFFRGGQAHGRLRKDAIASAMKTFCLEHINALQDAVVSWSACMSTRARADHVRAFIHALAMASKTFLAGDYWTKRFLEILLLVNHAKICVAVTDLDLALDVWPMGPGTKEALVIMFPSANTDYLKRQGIRVIQRSLGAGKRSVAVIQVSALLCFWKRARTGKIAWPLPEKQLAAATTGGGRTCMSARGGA